MVWEVMVASHEARCRVHGASQIYYIGFTAVSIQSTSAFALKRGQRHTAAIKPGINAGTPSSPWSSMRSKEHTPAGQTQSDVGRAYGACGREPQQLLQIAVPKFSISLVRHKLFTYTLYQMKDDQDEENDTKTRAFSRDCRGIATQARGLTHSNFFSQTKLPVLLA